MLFLCVMKRKAMFRLLFFAFSLSLLASCHPHATTNKYRDAKTHPSEEMGKENKKAAKRAQHVFLKTQKKNNKELGKKGSIWSKKKSQYTH